MPSKWLQHSFETVPGGVSSAVTPELLPPGQFAWGSNIAIRGGKAHTRPPMIERLVLPSGLHQCSSYFGVQGGMIVTNIQGRLYRLRIGANTFSFEEIPLGFVNSGTITQTWMQQTIESLVIQDGQSDAIIYNGSTARRAAANEVPRGRQMAYGNGRLWVAINQRELVAGDIRTRTAGSELFFTETNYLSGGGSLYFARGITGLEFIPVTGAADFGTLIVFGRDYAESIRADVTSRDMWAQMAGFVTNVFRDIGCAGDWSIVQVNQDLYWRDSRGDIRSLANAISTNNSPGSTPISREVQRLVAYDSDQLLAWVSAIYFDNRLLMTSSPYLNVSGGISFKDLVSLDFSPISTMQAKAPPGYDGSWNGVPGFAQLVAGEFDGSLRGFAISSGEDGVNRLWEIMTQSGDDAYISCGSGSISKIESFIEYPSVNFGLDKNRKRIERLDIWLSEVADDIEVLAYWRTDNNQKWTQWDSKPFCAKMTDATTATPHVWKNLLTQQRPQIKTFTIPDGLDPVTNYALLVGFEFQIRLVFFGKYQIERLMMYAWPLSDPDYAEESTEACIDNNVTGNEIRYEIPACSQAAPSCFPAFTFECRNKSGTATLIGLDQVPGFVTTVPKKFRTITGSGMTSRCNYNDGACSSINGSDSKELTGTRTYNVSTGAVSGAGVGIQRQTIGACPAAAILGIPGPLEGEFPIPIPVGAEIVGFGYTSSETQQTLFGKGVCYVSELPGSIATGSRSIALSNEDTEADAIARMSAETAWGAWSEQSQCNATYQQRTSGFSFTITEAQIRVTGTGITPGFDMTASVPIYRRAIGDPGYTFFQTRIYSASANGLGVAQIEANVPNDAGFDTYAGVPTVTAQRCSSEVGGGGGGGPVD